MAAPFVLGVDAGGTRTRCVAVDVTGRVLGRGVGGAGNPTSHPEESAVAALTAAVQGALTGLDPRLVRAGVFGVAGGGEFFGARCAEVLASAGAAIPALVRGDSEIAFASGTPAGAGTVLIAGTGMAAARIEDGREVAVHDGLGWLLGDAGSGFWIGREAVRAALADTDRRPLEPPGDPGALTRRVMQRLCGGLVNRPTLIRAVHSRAPVALSELSTDVAALAAAGDLVADSILGRSALLLLAAVQDLRADDDTDPVVLAGGVACGDAVGGRLRRLLAASWPTAQLLAVGSGEIGAAWLALREVAPGLDPDAHRRLAAASSARAPH